MYKSKIIIAQLVKVTINQIQWKMYKYDKK